MSYELLIARRLRFKDDGSSGVSPSIVIAIAGIALSLVIMMTAMCVVLGFKNEIRSKVMGFDAHVMILPGLAGEYESQSGLLSFTPELREVIDDTKAFASAALVLEQPGILKTDTDYQGVVVKGMQPGAAWDFVKSNLVEGCVPDYSDDYDKNRVVISRSMADALNLGVDDRINAYFFTGNAVRARRLDIAGIYDTHFSDYDKLYVFGSLPLTQGLNSADASAGSRIELRVNDENKIDDDALLLQDAMMRASYNGLLDGMYRINSVHNTGMMYFNWLELLDTNVVVILVLMTLVSGFTLISSLFIIILERVNMIGILKALGATNGEVRRIFIYLVQRLVLWGMLAGNAVGITFLLLQRHYHLLPLDPDAYYLNYVPVEINWWYILALNVSVFVVSWLMVLAPSHMVSTISPSQSIRYE